MSVGTSLSMIALLEWAYIQAGIRGSESMAPFSGGSLWETYSNKSSTDVHLSVWRFRAPY